MLELHRLPLFLDIITFSTPRGQRCPSLSQVSTTVAATYKDVAGFNFPLTIVVALLWGEGQLTPKRKMWEERKRGADLKVNKRGGMVGILVY